MKRLVAILLLTLASTCNGEMRYFPGSDPESATEQHLRTKVERFNWCESRGYKSPEHMQFSMAWDLYTANPHNHPRACFSAALEFMYHAGYPKLPDDGYKPLAEQSGLCPGVSHDSK